MTEKVNPEEKREMHLCIHLKVRVATASEAAAWEKLWAWLLSPAEEEGEVEAAEGKKPGIKEAKRIAQAQAEPLKFQRRRKMPPK